MVSVLNDQDGTAEAGTEFPLVSGDGNDDSAFAPDAGASAAARPHASEHACHQSFISRVSVVCKHRENRGHAVKDLFVTCFFTTLTSRSCAKELTLRASSPNTCCPSSTHACAENSPSILRTPTLTRLPSIPRCSSMRERATERTRHLGRTKP